MLTVDDLKSIRRERVRVRSLQERIERLRTGAEYPLRRLGEATASRGDRDKLAEAVALIMDLERELVQMVISVESKAEQAERKMARLPEQQAMVLRLYYCNGLKWREVSKEAHYTMRHCFNIRDRGLDRLPEC
jgi:DNA-directed RNA polymerase specialized sigma24 family protein